MVGGLSICGSALENAPDRWQMPDQSRETPRALIAPHYTCFRDCVKKNKVTLVAVRRRPYHCGLLPRGSWGRRPRGFCLVWFGFAEPHQKRILDRCLWSDRVVHIACNL